LVTTHAIGIAHIHAELDGKIGDALIVVSSSL